MSNQVVKISLDGGVTFQPAVNDVRVVYENITVPVDGEETDGTLQITINAEGVSLDLWGTRDEHLDTHAGTGSILIGDLVDGIYGQGV
jgi:hypothetical protein